MAKLDGSSKDCAVCGNKKFFCERQDTVRIYETNSRKLGLHPGVCFKIYHTKVKYKSGEKFYNFCFLFQ